jgi:hypothetical protein
MCDVHIAAKASRFEASKGGVGVVASSLGALGVGSQQRGFPALRRELERAFGRLRGGMWPVVQTAVAASVAWSVAALVLGHERPFVAAIAAVISVGAVAGQTLRRAAEWIFRVAADRDLLSIRSTRIITPEQRRSERRN